MRAPSKLVWSASVLAALGALVAAAGFVAPYDYAEQHRDFPYAAPMAPHVFDAEGRFHLRPFVYALKAEDIGAPREDRSRRAPIRFLTGGRLFGVNAPDCIFLFGSDGNGRDVFSRVLYGGRVSLLTGLGAALLALLIGSAAGVAAGYFGGWADRLLMRGGELAMALPWLYVLLGARAFLPLRISTAQSAILLIGIVGAVGWVRPARVIRGVALAARERPYVAAARGFGASHGYLMRRHVLPATYGVALTQATILVPQFLLAEVTLSFLGLGIGEPVPSWGTMLAEARQYHALTSHPWLLAPALAAIPVLLVFFILADSLHSKELA
jgi:peptide/nickel transport system permease protein